MGLDKILYKVSVEDILRTCDFMSGLTGFIEFCESPRTHNHKIMK